MNNDKSAFYTVIHQIPHGKISTYGRVAALAGFPRRARLVGKLLSNLPQDSSLPWHRVLNSQGKISLKGEDLLKQKKALEREGIRVSDSGRVSLKHYLWQL